MHDSDYPRQDDTPAEDDTTPHRCRGRGGIDPVTLVVGIVSLLVAAYTLSDGASWIPPVDLRWVLAGSAVVTGILLLGASMRDRHR